MTGRIGLRFVLTLRTMKRLQLFIAVLSIDKRERGDDGRACDGMMKMQIREADG